MIVTPLRIVAVGLLALCAVPFALSQPQPAAADVKTDDVKKLQNIGADTCRRCHRAPQPEDEKDKITEFLRLDEYALWHEKDLHSKAFEVLDGPLGKQMGAILGWGDMSKRVECLACHAVNLAQELTPGVPRPATSVEVFHTKDGVGCEACHGAADKWFRPHFVKSWRQETPEKKLAEGERDMRNPEARAERCASCHVGNSAEGKFVTHAMYAAGHPPLPPLESMTFSRDQPMHYIPPNDNKYFNSLSADDAWKLFHYRKGESAAARQAAVGAAVGFREAMRTLAHAAETAESTGGPVLDFALFDCAACHHDLVVPSWRQDGRTVPGRPTPRTGPTSLLRTLARNSGDGDVDAKFAALSKACDAQPFGKPSEIAPAARALAAWSDGLAKKFGDAHYDDAATAKLLRDLAETARRKDGRELDYDDAQQLLWAFTAIHDGKLPPAAEAEVAKLAGPGSDKLLMDKLAGPGQRKLIAEVLPDRLDRVRRYRPDAFRSAFDRIAGTLEPAGR
jgi:hypothetical protein